MPRAELVGCVHVKNHLFMGGELSGSFDSQHPPGKI